MDGRFSKGLPPDIPTAVLREVRTARHELFDRVVFEFDATRTPGYELGYLEEPAVACGSGAAVQVQGRAVLQVQFLNSRAHTDSGQPTVQRKEYRLPAYPTLREIERTCDFEGTVTYVIGVSSRHKFRILELNDPPRFVIDIRNDKVLPDSLMQKK